MNDMTDEELHRIAHPSRFTWDVAPTPRETTMAVEAIRHRAMVKTALLADANARVERLWVACNAENSGFTPGERKAIADAGHSIRSVVGGWARGRR